MTADISLHVESRLAPSRGLGPARYRNILRLVDENEHITSPTQIALRLVLDVAVLNKSDLTSAAGRSAAVYRDGDTVYLEWPRPFDFRDRRVISPALARAIANNDGPALNPSGWTAAAATLRSEYGHVECRLVWDAFLEDARQWWGDWLTPPLQSHAQFEAPFQVLPAETLARRAGGRTR